MVSVVRMVNDRPGCEEEKYLLRKLYNLGSVTGPGLPECNDIARHIRRSARRKVLGGVWLSVIYQIVPGRDAYILVRLWRGPCPVHMLTGILNHPDHMSQQWYLLGQTEERQGARTSNQSISLAIAQQLASSAVWLVVWNEDRGQIVEGAG